MAKLFPPLIEGTIPAFYSENGIVKITIPFSLNKSVSPISVKGLSLKIKTVQSSSYLYSIVQEDYTYINFSNSPYVIFKLDNFDNLKLGQFYKLQLAFIDKNDEIGYYSSVGVAKFTTKPQITIDGFFSAQINAHNQKYIGIYDQSNGDKTEKVYSYWFDVYDNSNNNIISSGELIHNSYNDVEENYSTDEFTFMKELPLNTIYKIQYTVKTANGLIISSPKYRIAQKQSIDAEFNLTIEAENNYDNGFIDIFIKGDFDENGFPVSVTGTFCLSRSCEDEQYFNWEEVAKFSFAAQAPNGLLWRDYTTEQGKKYCYALQQYNDYGIYSNKILSNEVYADFEDMFLFDGERQLKIRYNPKVTSFKVNVLEAKTDTIGSQFPYILRNGNTYYKEFPISGLISYYIDNDELFLQKNEYNYKDLTTNLTSQNINQERNFKMNVYEWLTNGNLKLFRSPGEGNFIVRLMNVSLTPNDAVNRMLHTFNSTAYEIAAFSHKNLQEFNFIKLIDPQVQQMRWKTVSFYDKENHKYRTEEKLNDYPFYTLQVTDMLPGDQIELVNSDGTNQVIQIGVTGSYYIDLKVPIMGFKILKCSNQTAQAIYGYYSLMHNSFNKITKITIEEVPNRQFIGKHDILTEITCVQDNNGNWIKNPKITLLDLLNINIQKRSIEKVRYAEEEDKYYLSRDNSKELNFDTADPFTLFSIGEWQEKNVGYRPGYPNIQFIPSGKYLDVSNFQLYSDNNLQIEEFKPEIKMDDSIVSVNETHDFDLTSPKLFSILESGSGIIANIAYKIRIIDYAIEETSQEVAQLKGKYLTAIEKLEIIEKEFTVETNRQEYQNAQKNVRDTYTQYILALIKAQEEEEKEEKGQ